LVFQRGGSFDHLWLVRHARYLLVTGRLADDSTFEWVAERFCCNAARTRI
jgi:hypothetical protein